MWLRMLVVAMMFVAAGLGGCKKEEPTPSEQLQQVQKDAQDTAEDMADQAQDVVDDMADQNQE